jgi:hypothetical protein
VRVLSKLLRRLMLMKLAAAHAAGQLQFFGVHARLADAKAFAAFLAPLRKKRWFVYSKRPFAGPKAVLAYLSRYTHRVAISNRRLIAFDGRQVTFKVKDYRIEGPGRYTTMTLDVGEFIIFPRVPSLKAFGRRPRAPLLVASPQMGPSSETLYIRRRVPIIFAGTAALRFRERL